MAGWTNLGKKQLLGRGYAGVALPTNYGIVLFTDAAAPGPDTDTAGDLTECPTGNGYTQGGISLNKNSTDFPTNTQDNINDRGTVVVKDITWSASGGNMPTTAARYAGLTDKNATPANAELYHYWDLVSNRQVSDGQDLTLQACEIRINES